MVFIYIEKLTQDALMSLSELITAIMTGQPWYIFKGPCRFSGRSYVTLRVKRSYREVILLEGL